MSILHIIKQNISHLHMSSEHIFKLNISHFHMSSLTFWPRNISHGQCTPSQSPRSQCTHNCYNTPHPFFSTPKSSPTPTPTPKGLRLHSKSCSPNAERADVHLHIQQTRPLPVALWPRTANTVQNRNNPLTTSPVWEQLFRVVFWYDATIKNGEYG